MNQEEEKNASQTNEIQEPSTTPVVLEEAPNAAPEEVPIPAPKAGGMHVVLRPIHLVIAALCATAVIAGGIVLGMQINKWMMDPDIDPDAEKYPYPGITDVSEDQIAVPGYSTVRFPANSKKVNIVLPNPDENPCYFVFSIVLTETGETVYRSGMVPPGMALTEITLNRPLESGTYSIEIRIETFSLEDKSPMNGANVKATLVVS